MRTRTFALAMLILALAACGDEAPKPARPLDPPQEAVSQVGDVTIRANVVATMNLSDAMAQQYGFERDPDTVLLLVSVRRGAEGAESSVPASITATVSDLRGQRREFDLREIRSGDLVDYVGTTRVSRPDTLRFDLNVVRDGGDASRMQFSRDFAAD